MTRSPRIAVVGAGAIGGWVAAKLAASGCLVSVLARGATLAAIRSDGLRLAEDGQELRVAVSAAAHASELGVHDTVVVAVKAPALSELAASIAELAGTSGAIVPMLNGVPWWFFGAEPTRAALRSVDPEGRLLQLMPADRVVGCVVHASSATDGPGRIRLRSGSRLVLGEAIGGRTARLESLANMFRAADFHVTVSERIQRDVCFKLWGNMTMNPISALTGATCDKILDDPLVHALIVQVMGEAAEIGARIDCPITEDAAARNAVTRRLGAFKTSMLQDVEAGRAIEIDALLSAPREIADQVGLNTPGIDALLGLTRVFARQRGLYHG